MCVADCSVNHSNSSLDAVFCQNIVGYFWQNIVPDILYYTESYW